MYIMLNKGYVSAYLSILWFVLVVGVSSLLVLAALPVLGCWVLFVGLRLGISELVVF